MSEETKVSVKDQVKAIISKATPTETGALVLTKEALTDIPEEIAYAAQTELRYINTQKEFTKTRQELKKISTVNNKVINQLTETAPIILTAQQKDELSSLKIRDPDAWRTKLATYEEEAKARLSTKLQEYEEEGKKLSEMEVRAAKVAALAESSGINITQEMVENELPLKYTKDLEAGKVTFDEFLQNAVDYLTKNKTIANTDAPPANDKNLSNAPGGTKPSKGAQEGSIVETYEKTIF